MSTDTPTPTPTPKPKPKPPEQDPTVHTVTYTLRLKAEESETKLDAVVPPWLNRDRPERSLFEGPSITAPKSGADVVANQLKRAQADYATVIVSSGKLAVDTLAFSITWKSIADSFSAGRISLTAARLARGTAVVGLGWSVGRLIVSSQGSEAVRQYDYYNPVIDLFGLPAYIMFRTFSSEDDAVEAARAFGVLNLFSILTGGVDKIQRIQQLKKSAAPLKSYLESGFGLLNASSKLKARFDDVKGFEAEAMRREERERDVRRRGAKGPSWEMPRGRP